MRKCRPHQGRLIVRIVKALYGLVQSAALWFALLYGYLVELGFVSNWVSKCVMNLDKDETKDPFLLFLQYRGKCSDEFSKDIQNICMKPNAAFQFPIKIVFTLKKLKSVLPPLKEKVSKMLKSNVVYNIICPGCEASYVRQTARQLLHRFREHKNNPGSVNEHFVQYGESLVDENITILTVSSNE